MRPIDADRLIKELGQPLNWTDSEEETQEQYDYAQFHKLINSQPSVTLVDIAEHIIKNREKGGLKMSEKNTPKQDLVEVVRCEHCKYWSHGERFMMEQITKPNDFCSYGKEGKLTWNVDGHHMSL